MSLMLRLALAAVFVLSVALLMLLAAASSSSSTFDRYYPWIVGANTVLATAMAAIAVLVVLRVWQRYRKKVFGARIMVRLAIAFALIAIIPVTLVSVVSAQFLAQTIDTWFAKGVDVALQSGVSLGRASLDGISSDAMSRARRLALAVEDLPSEQMTNAIERVVDGREGIDIVVLSGSGAVLASRSASLATLVPQLPPAEMLSRARAARQYVVVEPALGGGDRRLQVRAIAMSIRASALGEETRFVQWVEQIPEALSKNLEALNDGVREYDQLVLGKKGLRKIYGATLLFTLLLAFFGALVSAVLLSGWLAGPLRQLERATKAVAFGDYRPLRADPASNDELNVLVRSFNAMTSQLNEAREIAQKSRLRLEESNLFLQQVLAHLSAGVMVLDEDWRLVDVNASAERILGTTLRRTPSPLLSETAVIGGCADQLLTGLSQAEEVQFQFEARRDDGNDITLLVSATLLPGRPVRRVLIFDDIGELLSAQRAKDFAEIARRLAHEIKNPLTPIQLSAERLERRLLERLQPEDAELLGRSTRTIVEQVNALKAMVDEFRNYARLPAPNPQAVHVFGLLAEMQTLYASDKRISWPATDSGACVHVDRSQLIQVVHNLIQNAQDAVAESEDGQIEICIDELTPGADPLSRPQADRVRLMVLDNGPGISPEARKRLFEPYYTSKAKGSGLGLAIVKRIVEENGGKVSLVNRSEIFPQQARGAAAVVEFAKLGNASDNSRSMEITSNIHG